MEEPFIELTKFKKCLKEKHFQNHHAKFIPASTLHKAYFNKDEEAKTELKQLLVRKFKIHNKKARHSIIKICLLTSNLTFLVKFERKKGSGRLMFCNITKSVKGFTNYHVIKDEHEMRLAEIYYEFEQKATKIEAERLVKAERLKDLSQMDIAVPEEMKVKIRKDSRRLQKSRKALIKMKLNKRICVLVSHPHGCSKFISFGLRKKNENYSKQIEKGERLQFDDQEVIMYTTPSCPGSSGGPIIYLNSMKDFIHRGFHSDLYNISASEIKM